MKDSKIVLVLERSSENLGITKDGNEIVLEGVFAQFGVINNNDRIYEENEYLPHLDYLQAKILKKGLLGELDHPDKFDISLTKVSHIVEKLDYNKEKRQLIGRVRLLDTPSGKIAKELVESGVPISISSRAAGLVESNKKVKIKKIFTYDLVADPGFENAVLSKMNESLGIINENVAIYDVTSQYPDLLENYDNVENEKQQTQKTYNNMDYVTSEELNTYSLILKEEIETIHNKIQSISENADLVEKMNGFDSSIAKISGYIDYLTKSVNENIESNSILSEKFEQISKYSEYVAKSLNESIETIGKIAEKSDKSIQYGEYLKEQIEKTIDYSEYLKECIEHGVSYSEYLAGKLDKGIEYSEYVANESTLGTKYAEYVAEQANLINEQLTITASYANYLGESLNNGIAYSEYVGEQAQEIAEYTEFMLNERKNETVSDKTVNEENKPTDYSSLTDKVDNIIESIKKQKIDNANTVLDESKNQKINNALNESGNQTADNLVKSLISESQEEKKEDDWLTNAPDEYKTLWESLDLKVKNVIMAQSKFYKLDTPYQIKNFWETRKLNKVDAINESMKVVHETPSNLGYSPSYLENIKNSLDKFSKK